MSQRGGTWYGFSTRSRRRGGSARGGSRTPTQRASISSGRDEREQRADVGVGLAADVLAGARPQRVVERGLVRVDEEVDRRRSRSRRAASPSPRRRPRRSSGRAWPEAASPSYQWTRTRRPRRGLPVEPGVGVDDADRGPRISVPSAETTRHWALKRRVRDEPTVRGGRGGGRSFTGSPAGGTSTA